MDNNLAQWIERRLAKNLHIDYVNGRREDLQKLLKEIKEKA